ncbi:MAG: aminoglycoside phosphotransferase family protein [SAR202 cluster bacterium]|jgi:spectinomycin phosphotransferase|nr:aminoglycoside phosphotransferase family protein [SAR202 cluster bacterium]
MLEPPNISDDSVIACLRDEYGLGILEFVFLPIGADRSTAVYRAGASDSTPYFVKLRLNRFNATSVELPKFLGDCGIRQVIAPLATESGRPWAEFDDAKLMLYPFVEGRNGYEVTLSDRHWREFGAALNQIYEASIPEPLVGRIRREDYSPRWREDVKRLLGETEATGSDDAIAVELKAFLASKRDEILDLVHRAEQLADSLQSRDMEFVLCHFDLHVGNVLIDSGEALYIVDWDEAIIAPKERDLMFVGGGLMNSGRAPAQEESIFYEGYGEAQIDQVALAYYRFERIVEDISEDCVQIFPTSEGVLDRERSFQFFQSDFQPGGVLDVARKTDHAS